MATVVFLDLEGKESVRVEAHAGEALVDLADRSSSPIPFSCRSASCGTCRVVVVEGAVGLDDPRDEELDVLDCFASKPPRLRLACQAKLGAAATLVRVRPARDDE